MSNVLTRTIMSVVFAGMGLLGNTRVVRAEEVGNSKFKLLDSPQTEYVVKNPEDPWIEMARILHENTDNKRAYHQMDYAYELFDMQLALPKIVKRFMNVNADKVDFSRHSKFCIKHCVERDKYGERYYVYFNDASKKFARLSWNGVMVKTSEDPHKAFFECDGRIVRIDTERHVFSMIWLDEYGVDLATTVSPALNYDALEKCSEKVTAGLVRNFVKYFGISVPEQK